MKQNGTLGQAPQPKFGLSAPTYNFDALIDGTRCTPFMYELDLSTARDYAAGTAVQVKITGNCCLIDTAPDVGMAKIIFEGVQDFTAGQIRAPIFCRPGFVTRVPFANLYIANHAQPGKKLRIIYGVDIDFQELSPSRIDCIENPFDYQSAFTSGANLGINTAEQIVAPAANVNGLIVWQAQQQYSSAGTVHCNLVARTSAPALFTDGDILFMGLNSFGSLNAPLTMPRPITVPAGKGLWWFNGGTAQNFALRTCLYTLL